MAHRFHPHLFSRDGTFTGPYVESVRKRTECILHLFGKDSAEAYALASTISIDAALIYYYEQCNTRGDLTTIYKWAREKSLHYVKQLYSDWEEFDEAYENLS